MENKKEIWKDVVGYESIYKVSNLGNVYSCINNRLLTPYFRPNKYVTVTLSKKSKSKTYSLHRIVAEAFLINEFEYKDVNHKDFNKHNNKVSNLEWCTRGQNISHAYNNGLRKTGEKSHFCKLSNEIILEIKNLIGKNITQKEIARIYKINIKTVYRLKNNLTRKHDLK
jgi:hypothetical protein